MNYFVPLRTNPPTSGIMLMKHLWLLLMIVALGSCKETEEQMAADLLGEIESLYAKGRYGATLDSITALRERFPMAIEERRQALRIWQDTSLKMAQTDVIQTDSALQQTLRLIDRTSDIGQANRLRMRRDSLKARYEAMCGVVRMIHFRQNELRQATTAVNVKK